MNDGYDDYGTNGFVPGLGYSRSSSAGPDNQNVDQLMKHYMQQCLNFHHEEEAKRQQQQQGIQEPPHFIRPVVKIEEPDGYDDDSKIPAHEITLRQKMETEQSEETAIKVEEPPSSIPTSILTDSIQQQYSNFASMEATAIKLEEEEPLSPILSEPQQYQQPNNLAAQNEEIKNARARAQAVLARFQQQQEAVLLQTQPAPMNHAAQQRQAGLARELLRKEQCKTKNFIYVAKRERERLELESKQVEEAQQFNVEYRALLEERQLTRLNQRKRVAAESRDKATETAGIGTSKQQKRVAAALLPTVAVYVSGFPTDGSMDEQFITGLFSSYGRIRKIHFYHDKKSGDLKGDGLVIYETDQDQETLVETVCGQVRVE
jgi:hypothetical protein